tara:strand:- start:9 stop:674 length:666 start_codon:yes stop_codon:yes gene_type:complete
MNTKFATLLFLSLIVLFSSSCRKEEGCMNPLAINYNPDAEEDDGSCLILGCTNPTMFNYDPNANTDNGGCIPFINGCTDATMFNYDPNANTDNGTCLTAQQAAIGFWDVSPDCDDITVPVIGSISLNDQIPDNIEVNEGSGDIIFIDLGTSQIEGNIASDGTIIVSPQNTNIDLMGFSVDLAVSGDGLLETENSGYMDLDYELDIPIVGTQNVSCSIILTR